MNDILFNNYIKIKNDYFNINFISHQFGGAPVKKWSTLVHNGVMFHPPYEPHNIPILYENEPISLNPEAEEFITYYVQTRFDKYRNDRFKKNFFKDWKKLLNKENRLKIKDFNKCNFDNIKTHITKVSEEKKEKRKNMSKKEREEEKKKNDIEKDKYRYATVDDKKQMIDNFIVEPPTIFTGRGDHPLTGSIKKRLYPEDITLNIGPDMNIPIPNIEQKENKSDITDKERWGDIICDNTLEWIASWQNNVTQKYNYARFGRKSTFKMKSDENKYDLARKLKNKIKKIREKNNVNMESTDYETRQLATALYLIDKLALRVGNEKKEDEANTVGVTTLKKKNVVLLPNNTIKLDFLGKDSIRYVNKFIVPEIVYKNIKEFNDKNTNNMDDIFDVITSDSLNKYIKKFMKKLTSKVFRTYNASYLMQMELRKISNKYKDYNKPDKLQKILHEYEMANLKVAKLCNHQKEVSKTATVQLDKTNNKIKELKSKINKLNREKNQKLEKGIKTTSINKRINKIQEQIKVSLLTFIKKFINIINKISIFQKSNCNSWVYIIYL